MGRVDFHEDPGAPKPTGIAVAVSAFVRDDAGRLLVIRRTDNDRDALPPGVRDLLPGPPAGRIDHSFTDRAGPYYT